MVGNFKFGTDVSAVNAPAYGIFGANVYSNNGNGGSVTIQAGSGSGSGINGDLILRAGQTSSPVSITTGGNLILESGKPSNTLVGGYIAFNTYSGNPSSVLERMRISSSGNILIGQASQANPDYKLDVYGKARANEIVVNTSGADFVFDKKYSLPKLSDVKAYIDKNKHLPEIPSAKEMQTNGMSVGEIDTKLLQKVEELTLYLIEKDKQLSDQQQNIKSQQAQIDELKEQLKSITRFHPQIGQHR
ncbi:MAG TPA: hypothetical protein VL442_04900 [Mucilaginibacter sp.]|nr:hypothetical protein [Mucilaginibacter sp.]